MGILLIAIQFICIQMTLRLWLIDALTYAYHLIFVQVGIRCQFSEPPMRFISKAIHEPVKERSRRTYEIQGCTYRADGVCDICPLSICYAHTVFAFDASIGRAWHLCRPCFVAEWGTELDDDEAQEQPETTNGYNFAQNISPEHEMRMAKRGSRRRWRVGILDHLVPLDDSKRCEEVIAGVTCRRVADGRCRRCFKLLCWLHLRRSGTDVYCQRCLPVPISVIDAGSNLGLANSAQGPCDAVN